MFVNEQIRSETISALLDLMGYVCFFAISF